MANRGGVGMSGLLHCDKQVDIMNIIQKDAKKGYLQYPIAVDESVYQCPSL